MKNYNIRRWIYRSFSHWYFLEKESNERWFRSVKRRHVTARAEERRKCTKLDSRSGRGRVQTRLAVQTVRTVWASVTRERGRCGVSDLAEFLLSCHSERPTLFLSLALSTVKAWFVVRGSWVTRLSGSRLLYPSRTFFFSDLFSLQFFFVSLRFVYFGCTRTLDSTPCVLLRGRRRRNEDVVDRRRWLLTFCCRSPVSCVCHQLRVA